MVNNDDQEDTKTQVKGSFDGDGDHDMIMIRS